LPPAATSAAATASCRAISTILHHLLLQHGRHVQELDTRLTAHPNQFYRIGSGELTDSLTFEHITEQGPELVAFFAERRNAIIELKSKNIHIEGLSGLNHKRRTVVSWSLNAEAVRQSDEGVSATIAERLEAAREMQAAGYRLGFHFDPMIFYAEWREGYRETIDQIFRVIKPESIAWMSLGACVTRRRSTK